MAIATVTMTMRMEVKFKMNILVSGEAKHSNRLCYVNLIVNLIVLGAIHTSELDRSEIDVSPKRSECERSNAN